MAVRMTQIAGCLDTFQHSDWSLMICSYVNRSDCSKMAAQVNRIRRSHYASFDIGFVVHLSSCLGLFGF